MKVVLVQDWLTELGGAEHVFSGLLKIFPNADIVTLSSHKKVTKKLDIEKRNIKESFIANLPFGRTKYRNYLPFFKKAIESFDLSEYDLIISSSSSVAKGVLVNTNQLHICYCHSPVRYAWDLYHEYMKDSKLNGLSIKGWYARHVLHKLRIWDVISSNRVDYFVANSEYIKKRIKKVYRRSSTVIYPPVDIDRFSLCEEKKEFYFTASRLVPYKKIDLIVEAFSNMPNKRLIVAGTGPGMNNIKKLATKNIQILGYVSDEEMNTLMQEAKAFVFAADEDFGIIPLEAQASGTPVIALGKGGTKETVIDGETGVHFYEQTTNSIMQAVAKFERVSNWDYKKIRLNAERFSKEIFRKGLEQFVKKKFKQFKLDS